MDQFFGEQLSVLIYVVLSLDLRDSMPMHRVKIAIVLGEFEYLLPCEKSEIYQLYPFRISPQNLSFSEIFDSAFASPARYVLELFRRVKSTCQTGGQDNPIFIFNPLFDLGPDSFLRVVQSLDGLRCSPFPRVVSNSINQPIGYYFPPSFDPADDRYLLLLSTVSSIIDNDLFSYLYGGNDRIFALSEIYLGSHAHGFMGGDIYREIWLWTAERALAILKDMAGGGNAAFGICRRGTGISLKARKRLSDAVRWSVYNPHHAGDVLFLSIAANHVTTHFNSMIVNKRYRDIAMDVAPDFGLVSLDAVPPNRDNNLMAEEFCFFDHAESIPLYSFFYYGRPSRDYNATELHMIDHFAFALGAGCQSRSDLVTERKPVPPPFRPKIPCSPIRLLLHFDAGWGLKIYPPHYRIELINLLHAKGYKITVLGTEETQEEKFISVTFKGYAEFKELLETHHLLLGSDSFPSHLATHVVGLPTICLFGPTKPANSNARVTGHYRYLEKGLKCRPCYCQDICPLGQKMYCDNFVEPAQLLIEIESMLERVYGEAL